MKLFVAALGAETNTFSPLPTGTASYRGDLYFAAGQHPDEVTFFGGPLIAARRRGKAQGWQVIEGMVASAAPGGITTRDAYESLRDELLADLDAALPVDMVLLGLHGAMVADGYEDCEGDLLRRARERVGPGVILGATLDPHAHLSDAMVAQADLLIAFKEYPHTDILERADELVDRCIDLYEGRLHACPAVIDCEMIVPIHTTREPARGYMARVRALEGQGGIFSISVVQGFATGDVPDMGTKVLVYHDGDAVAATHQARQLADELIALRDGLQVAFRSIDDAIDDALAAPPGLVVMADRPDNPGSGAPGDATFILRRLIERGVRDVALGPLWDPGAVRIAFEAGVGARLPLRIGGKIGPLSGDPVDRSCVVEALRPGYTMTGLTGSPVPLGDAALVHANGIRIVLVSMRDQAMHTDLFTGIGCELESLRIVVVKSAQHFHAAFAPLACRVIYVGGPGVATPDWKTLTYTRIRRPRWPISCAR
ncbi:microcystinase C [Pigmentiphaga litoralis]|uniref:M81 family metallopeptidase n=1 Tax=Pigmentiphaga litoralis TaxID=516702 RepID=UPI0016772D0F|nr:M81 family metallopeptidase [Pigmentiphaga litoralis]GGX21645.1 microcystinase C [Pigmentiphaga litoralis]